MIELMDLGDMEDAAYMYSNELGECKLGGTLGHHTFNGDECYTQQAGAVELGKDMNMSSVIDSKDYF